MNNPDIDYTRTRSGIYYPRFLIHEDPTAEWNENLAPVTRGSFQRDFNVDEKIRCAINNYSQHQIIPVPKNYEAAAPSFGELAKCYPSFYDTLIRMFRNAKREVKHNGWFDFLFRIAWHHCQLLGRMARIPDQDPWPFFHASEASMWAWHQHWYEDEGIKKEVAAHNGNAQAFLEAVDETLDFIDDHFKSVLESE